MGRAPIEDLGFGLGREEEEEARMAPPLGTLARSSSRQILRYCPKRAGSEREPRDARLTREEIMKCLGHRIPFLPSNPDRDPL